MGKKITFSEKYPEKVIWLMDKHSLELPPASNKLVNICCPECKSKFSRKLCNFARSSNCPYCTGHSVNKTNWAYSNIEMLKCSKNKEILKTVTQNSNKYNTWICLKCKSDYQSAYCTFQKGIRCPYCHGTKVNKTNWAYGNREMKEWAKNSQFLKTVTNGSNKKIVWICIDCKKEWNASIKGFLRGRRCPYCNNSKGEKCIEMILSEHHIENTTQYRFPDCRNNKPLPFDHAIFNDGKLIGLIEFHGTQHYNPIEYWGGKKHLESIQLRDQIKLEYCQKHNIPLLIIPYTIENIEQTILHWINGIIAN